MPVRDGTATARARREWLPADRTGPLLTASGLSRVAR